MAKLKPLKLVLAGVDKASAPVLRLSRRIDKLTAPIRKVRGKLRQLDRATGFRTLRMRLGRVGRSLGVLAKRAALFGTAMLAAGAVAFKKFIDVGDSIAKTAGTIGIGVEALQEWRFAADRSGVSSEKMDKALQVLSRNLGDVKAGTGTLITILKKLDPTLLKNLRSVQTTEEGMDILIDAMAEMDNQLERNSLAAAAFGRSGILLANLLKLPQGEIKKLRQQARDLGLVMSEETARSAEEAQDRLTDLGAVVKGVGFSIASQLLPVLITTVEEIIGWTKENQEFIKVDIPKHAKAMAESVKGFLKFVKETTPKVKSFVEALGGLKTIGLVIAGVIGVKLVTALALFSIALLSTPAGQIISLIALAITGLVLAIKGLMKLKDPLLDLFSSIGDFFSSGLGKVVSFASGIGSKLGFGRSQSATGGGGSSGGTTVRNPSAQVSDLIAGTRFDGQLNILLTQDKAPRVTHVESSTPAMEISVETGMTLLPQGT